MVTWRRLLALLALVLASTVPVSAATYYVSPTTGSPIGSDARSCGTAQTISTPKATLGSAVACLTPGDTLLVRAGTYVEALIGTIPSGTSWSNKVRIAAYPSETVWMRPTSASGDVLRFTGTQQFIEIDGIGLDGTNITNADVVNITDGCGGVVCSGNNAHHIRIQNAEVIAGTGSQGFLLTGFDGTGTGHNEFLYITLHGNGGSDFVHGFYVSGNPNNLIDHCEIYDFTGAAIHLYSGYGHPFASNVVSNNRIHDARSTGAGQRHWGLLIADYATDTVAFNNAIWGMPNEGASAVGLFDYAGLRSLIYNNTIYGGGGEGLVEEIYAASGTLKNNISYANAGGNWRNSGTATNFDVPSNMVGGVDPQFVNAAAHDFHLSAASPARNTGATIALVTTDQDGTVRPQEGSYDIGALEFTSGVVIVSSPSCTSVPAVASLTDNVGADWRLGLGISPFIQILRNGVHVAAAYGAQILWYVNRIYAQGDDLSWYFWTGSAFTFVSIADPSGVDCLASSPALARGISVGWWLRF